MIEKLLVVSYMAVLAIPALIIGTTVPVVVGSFIGSICYALTPKP